MKRISFSALFFTLLAAVWTLAVEPPATTAAGAGMSGQGKYQFRVLYDSSSLPSEAQAVLEKAHGGFAVDRRSGKGETYFALPGAGIIKISADMKSIKMVPTDASMKEHNMHNATIWHEGGDSFLTFPGNGSNAVYTTTLDGKLVNTINPPSASLDLGHPNVSKYFADEKNKFIPTDTEYLDGMLYIATGYSPLDYVLTAKVSTKPFKAVWHDLAFGGKGHGIGEFGTGHGISIPPGTKLIDVADRPNSEIDRFTRHGQYIRTLQTPLGSLPCDIDYLGDYSVVGALRGPDTSKGAPVYLFEKDLLVSTIMIKEDLGLEKFTHIHNATIREMGGKLYIIAQAWNPGDFAILEQVM